jgi:hypothetical protein
VHGAGGHRCSVPDRVRAAPRRSARLAPTSWMAALEVSSRCLSRSSWAAILLTSVKCANLATILAAAVHELIDGHLGQRCRQVVDRRRRLSAAEKGPVTFPVRSLRHGQKAGPDSHPKIGGSYQSGGNSSVRLLGQSRNDSKRELTACVYSLSGNAEHEARYTKENCITQTSSCRVIRRVVRDDAPAG